MKKTLAYLILLSMIIICGCSKERIEQNQVNGSYAVKTPFPNIVLKLKKGKCVELYLESQNGLSFRTTDVRTGGDYPYMKYASIAEGEISGACDIAATFSSPDVLIANVGYYITNGEGLDAISWAGEIENVEFIRQTE